MFYALPKSLWIWGCFVTELIFCPESDRLLRGRTTHFFSFTIPPQHTLELSKVRSQIDFLPTCQPHTSQTRHKHRSCPPSKKHRQLSKLSIRLIAIMQYFASFIILATFGLIIDVSPYDLYKIPFPVPSYQTPLQFLPPAGLHPRPTSWQYSGLSSPYLELPHKILAACKVGIVTLCIFSAPSSQSTGCVWTCLAKQLKTNTVVRLWLVSPLSRATMLWTSPGMCFPQSSPQPLTITKQLFSSSQQVRGTSRQHYRVKLCGCYRKELIERMRRTVHPEITGSLPFNLTGTVQDAWEHIGSTWPDHPLPKM